VRALSAIGSVPARRPANRTVSESIRRFSSWISSSTVCLSGPCATARA
jgi:hypothetical protein